MNLKNYEKLDYCSLEETNLCYIEEEKISQCSYPIYNCSKCAENASLVDGVCQCNSGYYGLGYIYCSKENETGT